MISQTWIIGKAIRALFADRVTIIDLKICRIFRGLTVSYITKVYVIVIPCSPRALGVYLSKIPSSHGTSDIYHLGRTHLIGERINENSSHLFYTVASED